MWRKGEDLVVGGSRRRPKKNRLFAVSACARPASEFVRFARAAVRRREWPHGYALADTWLLSVFLLFTTFLTSASNCGLNEASDFTSKMYLCYVV